MENLYFTTRGDSESCLILVWYQKKILFRESHSMWIVNIRVINWAEISTDFWRWKIYWKGTKKMNEDKLNQIQLTKELSLRYRTIWKRNIQMKHAIRMKKKKLNKRNGMNNFLFWFHFILYSTVTTHRLSYTCNNFLEFKFIWYIEKFR